MRGSVREGVSVRECEGMLRSDESCMSDCLKCMIRRGEYKGWATVGVVRCDIVKLILSS